VQVTHQKASYYASAPPGTSSADVNVYDVNAKVAGVNGEIDALRIESDPSGSSLHVIELLIVKNDSQPPRTQFSDHSLDFYLPDGAVLGDSDAVGPGSSAMPLRIQPTALPGSPNHYAVDFALRPGESHFQIGYTLPYKGSLTLKAHPSLATDTVAVMIPKSMTFKAPSGSPFTAATDDPTVQTLVARSIPAGQQLAFTLSGSGQLPADNSGSGGAADQSGGMPGQPDGGSSDAGAASPQSNRPGGGMGAPIDTPDPLSKYKWWIIGGLLLAMAAIGGFLLSKPSGEPAGPAAHPHAPPIDSPNSTAASLVGRSTMDTLKEEMFTLETDRLAGKITDEEYAEHRAALETLLKRAIKRG